MKKTESGKIRDIQRQQGFFTILKNLRNREVKKQLQKEVFEQVYNRRKEKAFSDID
jgi:hypothetical protein